MAATLTTPNTILGVLTPKSQTSRLVSNIVVVILGTLVLAIASAIKVPLYPVPVNLATFAVALLAGAFGWRIGVATVALYIAEGLSGLPVFSFGGGWTYILAPSFGFILGYLPMAYIIGLAADRGASGRLGMLFLTMLIADAVLFALGFLWLTAVLSAMKGLAPTAVLGSAFDGAIKPFIIWDILKMALAAVTVAGGWQLIKKRA